MRKLARIVKVNFCRIMEINQRKLTQGTFIQEKLVNLDFNKKITKHAKKQERMAHMQEKKQHPVETVLGEA